MSRATQVYTAADSLEVFPVLSELLAKNRCALEFGAETLTELLYAEHYILRRVAAHEVEIALEALRVSAVEVLA